jgi:hypothetical protein
MSAADMGLGVVDAAVEAPVVDSATVDQTVDTSAVDNNVETAPEVSVEETTETETHNADGSEKTPEEQEAFKTAAQEKAASGSADPTPTAVRQALKSLKELDSKNAAVVKQLHGHFERYEAVRPLLGKEGPNGLKSLLADTGAKDITELRQSYTQTREQVEAVRATDELLYAADAKLCENVYDDMKAAGKEGVYGKVVANFLDHLKRTDATGYYETTKPHMVSGLHEVGFPAAINSVYAALEAGDTEKAKSVLKSMGGWFNNLNNEVSEKGKISKERAAWEAEKAKAGESEAAKARVAVENGIAETCDKSNNTILGKELGAFFKLPFFKDFKRENWIPLGNEIKSSLYAELKNDKGYQTQMSAMWKAKTPDKAKMVEYHNAKVQSIANRLVTDTVKRLYPGYAKGGSAAGKAAAANAAKAANTKASAQSVATGKPIYVASRPENIVREDTKIGNRMFTAEDLRTLQVAGRGYVRSTDGKSFKYVTWRR